MRGLNERFKENPVAFLNQVLLITQGGEVCPTCHRPLQLSGGDGGAYVQYVRPEPVIFTFDLIGGAYAGGINMNSNLIHMLNAQATGVASTDPTLKYANLAPMEIGDARVTRPTSYWTHKYTAYWLPWVRHGTTALQLTNLNVKFFFTAMFSGCTFAVATPAAGRTQVWATHIAWDPAGAAATPLARTLAAEAAFYTAHLAAGQPVRSVTSDGDALISGPLGLGGAGLPSNLIANGVALPGPNISQRIRYGTIGEAFIVGWRDNTNAWHFAVQRQPVGYANHGDAAMGAPAAAAVLAAGVVPVAVQQFF